MSVKIWAEYWREVAPFLTDEWQTITEVRAASGMNRQAVCFALKGAEKAGVVDFRFSPRPDNSCMFISFYRKKAKAAVAA